MLQLFHSILDSVESITGIVNNLINIFWTLITFNTWIGKVIVDFIVNCLIGVYSSICSVVLAITIMCEDFSYFLTDLLNICSFLTSAFDLVCSFVYSISKSCCSVVNWLVYVVSYLKQTICGFSHEGVKFIYNSLVTLKGAVILIGNVIWMCVIFIPGIFIYSVSMLGFFLNKILLEIRTIIRSAFASLCSAFSQTYYFIVDIPVQSCCGLLVALALIYVMHIHKENIIRVASKIFYQLFTKIQAILWMSLTLLFNRGKATPNVVPMSNAGCNFDRLCVVCKDNEPNILIMPCNHVCLCEDCSNYDMFRNYLTSSCPVCRHNIDGLLKVYF